MARIMTVGTNEPSRGGDFISAEGKPLKVMLVASLAVSLVVFRGNLIQELVRRGHSVICCAPERRDQVPTVVKALEGWGAQYTTVTVVGAGQSVVSDLQ